MVTLADLRHRTRGCCCIRWRSWQTRTPIFGVRTGVGALSQVYISFGEHAAIEVLDEALTLLADEPDDALVCDLLIEKGYALARVFEDPIQGEALLAQSRRDAPLLRHCMRGYWRAVLRHSLP